MSQTKKKIFKLGGFTILIVEDFKFIADLLKPSLRSMGVGTVQYAENGLKAQSILSSSNKHEGSGNIDVMITDWLMPEMDGPSLVKWVRNHEYDLIRFLPIIVCSAYTSRDVVERSRDMGANEVIVKPVSAEKVASRLQYVIDKPRPYIKAPGFFGPDRRRKNQSFPGFEKRKNKTEDLKQHHEQL